MITQKISFDGVFPPAGNIAGLTGKIMTRFVKEGGELIIGQLHDILGTDVVYVLQPGYAKRKPSHPRFRRFAGKQADQPGILSGDMYEALQARRDGATLVVEVKPSVGFNESGFDYVAWFEEVSNFMEKGEVLAIRDVADLFGEIVSDELLIK